MNPWPFVAGAYAVAIVATAILVLSSARTMRRAEARIQAAKTS